MVEHQGSLQSQYSLQTHGITNANTVWWNLSTPTLYEHALQPRVTWQNAQAYDAQARRLVDMFVRNFQPFAGEVSAEVCAAGPQTDSTV